MRCMDPEVVRALETELDEQARQLVQRVHDGRVRVERAQALLDAATQALQQDEQLLQQVQSLLPSAVAPALDTLDERLRGARLREVALQVLASRAEPGQPVHYRDWYAWMREAGFMVAGRDPLATFLAQVTRAESVRRVGGARSGRYVLAPRS